MQTRLDLIDRSLEILRSGQTPSGAFIASPAFPVYRYCWFRDGTFAAQALDLWGNQDAASRFYDWAVRIVLENADVVAAALATPPGTVPQRYLHTRYTLDGKVGEDDWPNFQLDGFGILLWGMVEHLRMSRLADVPGPWQEAIELLVAYLSHLWKTPCFDCWEEFPDWIHTSTLCAVYGGLAAVASHCGNTRARLVASEVRTTVLDLATDGGYLPKFAGSPDVDASELWAAVPFGMLEASHPVMARTVEEVERSLRGPDGGVHRYAADSYYGGGEWLLLTATLAEYRLHRGDVATAQSVVRWIEEQASAEGNLPEQIPSDLNVREMYEPWVDRWGPIAQPLLWSHAAYLRLRYVLAHPRNPSSDDVAPPR